MPNTNSPLVSVCIPAFNCEQFIIETIDCLLSQSYGNIEIIVVDDGSTDDTLNILNQITDPRLKTLSQHNQGASAARNTACEISKGEFIKFMDADDLINPGCIEHQLSKIVQKPGSIASAKWGRFYKEDASDFTLSVEKVWKDLPGIDWLIESLEETGANMMQPGIFLIPRSIIEKVGLWNESLNLIDDFEFMTRVIANTEAVLFCDEAVLMYRSGLQNNLSGSSSEKHMVSAFSSLQLGIANILKVENTERSRRACANTLKRWSFLFYPQHKRLYNLLVKEIDELGGSKLTMIGSKALTVLSNVVGWKTAKRLKLLLARTR